MENTLIHQHINKRLKTVFGAGIVSFFILFGLVFFLGKYIEIDTLYTEIILLSMNAIMVFTYISLLSHAKKISFIPMVSFVCLNLLTSALVWATGILQSPFIILYVILIIVSTQLYHYKYGLIHIVFAFFGYVFMYGAVTQGLLPFLSLLPYDGVSILFQPPLVIMVYGLLYCILLFFTVMSSSNARMMIYRPENKVDMDVTYQEKIIQDMPLGVLVVDQDLNILGNNPWADYHFPMDEMPVELGKYLIAKTNDLKKELYRLAKSGGEIIAEWKTSAGDHIDITISVRLINGSKKEHDTFVVFVQ